MEASGFPTARRPFHLSLTPNRSHHIQDLTIEDLTADECRMFVLAHELDNADRAFEPLPEDLPTCERLRELGILQRRMVDEGVAYDLSPAARTADRLSRLTETAQASVN